MNRKLAGLVLLLLGSEILGIVASRYASRIFDSSIPPSGIADLGRAAAHGTFFGYGVVLGLAIFAWALVAVWLARFFSGGAARSSA
jgi:hypothetical protein